MRHVLLIILLTGPAVAEPKYTRRPVEVRVNQSERSRRVEPRQAERPKPSLTGAQIVAAELALQPVRREQEALLERLVRDTPTTDADAPEHTLMLAEQYAKQFLLWRMRAQELAIELTARRNYAPTSSQRSR